MPHNWMVDEPMYLYCYDCAREHEALDALDCRAASKLPNFERGHTRRECDSYHCPDCGAILEEYEEPCDDLGNDE